MTRRAVAGVLLGMVAILGGCSAVVGPSGPAETATPASVPDVDETTDTPDGALPPGLTGGGIVDAGRLADAHLASIRGQSYTWDARTTFAGNVSNQRLRVERPRRYTYRQTSPGSRANTTEFADGEVTYTRYYRFVERLRRAPARTASDQYGPFAAGAIERYLAVENATVAEARVDGTIHYRIRARVDSYQRIDGARNYSVTAVIAPDGFVRELNATYVRRSDRGSIAVTYRFRYADVGTTTVEAPDWLANETWPDDSTMTPSETSAD